MKTKPENSALYNVALYLLELAGKQALKQVSETDSEAMRVCARSGGRSGIEISLDSQRKVELYVISIDAEGVSKRVAQLDLEA
jgi:hypothetical protein